MLGRFNLCFCIATVIGWPQPVAAQENLTWRFWKGPNQFPGYHARFVSPNPNGRIWFTTTKDAYGNSWFDGYQIGMLPQDHFAPILKEDQDGQPWGLFYDIPMDGSVLEGRVRGVLHYTHHGDLAKGRWIEYPIQELESAAPLTALQPWDFPFLPQSPNQIWILLQDSLLEFDAEKNQTKRIKNVANTALGFFIHMAQARDGNVWLTGQRGIAKLQTTGLQFQERNWEMQEDWQEYIPASNLELSNFIYPYEDESGDVFCTAFSDLHKKRVLVRLHEGKWEVAYQDHDADIIKGWRGADHQIWFLSSQVISDSRNLFSGFGVPAPELNTLDHEEKYTIPWKGDRAGRNREASVETDGTFWFGGMGLIRCAPSIWQTPLPVDLSSGPIRGIFEDRKGRLWFSGPKVLYLYEGEKWRAFQLSPSRQITSGIQTLSDMADGRLVIATRKGPLLLVSLDHNEATFKEVEHPKGRICWNVSPRQDGSVWLLTIDNPNNLNCFLEVFDGKDFDTLLGQDQDLCLGQPHRILELDSGDLWLAGRNGIGCFRNGNYRFYEMPRNRIQQGAYCLTETGKGRLWVGGPQGIHEFNGDEWKLIKTDLASVHHILKRRDGSIWAASQTGIHRLLGDTWLTNSEEDGLPAEHSYMVFEDKHNGLWASTAAGISLYDENADSNPPRSYIRAEENVAATGESGEIRIVYDGVDKWNFTEPGRLLYSTRLDSGPWSPFSQQTLASFARLRSGRHQFQVRAMDRNGNIETKPAVFGFIVARPWHRQPVFLAFVVIGTAIILVLIALHIYRHIHLELTVKKRTKDLRQAHQELLTYQEQLRSLASAISLIEERDRRHIAADLHDRIGHGLAVCQMQIEMLQRNNGDGKTGEMLEQTRNLIQQTIEDARTLTFEISPPVLYELGLEAALEWLVDEVQKRHNLKVELIDDGQSKDIGTDARGIVFRSIRELLHNIVKHAKAHAAKIRIQRVGEVVRIEIEDNGIGFNMEELNSESRNNRSFGLFSIRERIQFLGGVFECSSSPHKGTRCALIMPLKEK